MFDTRCLHPSIVSNGVGRGAWVHGLVARARRPFREEVVARGGASPSFGAHGHRPRCEARAGVAICAVPLDHPTPAYNNRFATSTAQQTNLA